MLDVAFDLIVTVAPTTLAAPLQFADLSTAPLGPLEIQRLQDALEGLASFSQLPTVMSLEPLV